ncbi:unnamed protein product [Adineta ricciae]|uniref:Uncharacterized protein n=1 Tax=Adineta ricciae TaxID=249248 RepID=A0A816ESY9_ADIRI|nr:unnamed protein product [Adineta ricciae]
MEPSSTPSTPTAQHITPYTTYVELEKEQPSISSTTGRHEKENFSHEDALNVLQNDERKKEIDSSNVLSRPTHTHVNHNSSPTTLVSTESTSNNAAKTQERTNQIVNSKTSTTLPSYNNIPVIIIEPDDGTDESSEQNHLNEKANSKGISDSTKLPLSTLNSDMNNKNDDGSSQSTGTSSQHSTAISKDVSIGDILSKEGKYASVSFPDEPRRHTISHVAPSTAENAFKRQMKTDLNTQIASNTNAKSSITHLNPDAPDFKPADSISSYHSELAPPHTQRRATHGELHHNRLARPRNHSDTHNRESLTNIQPLLSIVPQYVPYHRKSWSTPSTDSRRSSQTYPPLMAQPLLSDEENILQKQVAKRPRAQSGRGPMSSLTPPTVTRQRSHSGPEPSFQVPSSHLSGIHSLTRIMVDILRLITPISEQQQNTEMISSANNAFYSSLQSSNAKSGDGNVSLDEDKCTTPSSLLLLSNDKPTGSDVSLLTEILSLDLHIYLKS